jgi:hypothetical protein
VHPSDHAGILAWDESVASTVVGLAPCSGI